MAGFDPRSSIVGRDRYANCATTTAQFPVSNCFNLQPFDNLVDSDGALPIWKVINQSAT